MARLLVVLVLLLPGAGSSLGQEAPPITIGGFETQGSVTAGYRFTDVRGRKPKFDELFSLRSGFRLHDFTMMGRSDGGESFADSISVSASGLGGEPFAGGELRLGRSRVYDLRVSFSQSYYYWDRNDDVPQPTGLRSLTSNHDFATVRRLGSVDWTFHATPNLRLGVEYYRSQRDGHTRTLRTLEYFGAPSSWGGFLRSNPYLVEAPADEVSHRAAASIGYAFDSWSVFYRAGYQRYEETLELRNLAPGQRSVNVDEAATANEPLDAARWSEFRRLTAPFSEFSYDGDLHSRLSLRGGYLYYRHSGPARLDAAFGGVARTDRTGAALAPFTASMIAAGEVEQPNHVIDQGFTWAILDRVRLHSDYRYSRFTIDTREEFASIDAGGAHTGVEHLAWREGLHTLDIALEMTLVEGLLVRPGIRLVKRDITLERDGVADPEASRESKLASPILSVYYAPASGLTFRGDIRNTTNGGPYTRITPRTDLGGRGVVRYSPIPQVSIENAYRFRNAAYTTTDFENRVRSNSTRISYAVNDDLSLFGGFTYDSFLATASVRFLRGTPPLEATWRDQTINRVWEAGVSAHPVPALRFHLTGNYVRTTGLGEISDEPPTFGPLRWPLVTGTVSVDVPRAGTLSLDLQRTYYIEEILRGDNFSANILGIRWTLDF